MASSASRRESFLHFLPLSGHLGLHSFPTHCLKRIVPLAFRRRRPRPWRTANDNEKRTPFSKCTGSEGGNPCSLEHWLPSLSSACLWNSVKFGERTWDCSPGHAGNDGPHLAMTEGSCGFSRAAAPVWGFTRGTTGSSGSLSCGAREVRSPCGWRGGVHYCSRAMVGESDLKTH